MLTDKKVCEMAVHFKENKHEFKDLEFVAIEKVDLGLSEWRKCQ